LFNKNGRFLEKAFFSFAKSEDADKAIEIFNEQNYNQVMLEATVAEPASTYQGGRNNFNKRWGIFLNSYNIYNI